MSKVEMPEYPDNSESTKAAESMAPVEPARARLVKGKVIRKKKNALQRASESVFEEDGRTIGSYLVFDVLIPAAKDTLYSLMTNGMDMLLWGNATHGGGAPYRPYGASRSSYTAYNKYSQPDTRRKPTTSNMSRKTLQFDDIILDSRGDAERVLDYLFERLDAYDCVTVADLYDAVEITSDYTQTRYGWYDLSDAYVKRCRDGYQIVLPKAVVLDR